MTDPRPIPSEPPDWRDRLGSGFAWLGGRRGWVRALAWVLLFWILPLLWLLQWRRGRLGIALATAFGLFVTVPVLASALTDGGPPEATVAAAPSAATNSARTTPIPEVSRTPSPSPTSSPSPSPTASPPAATSAPPSESPEPLTPATDGGGAGLTTTVTKIVDGDTLYLADLDVRLRLIGMDTPETRDPRKGVQCFGREATARLTDLVPPGTAVRVVFDVDRTDRYGRPLGYLYRDADDLFVNLQLVLDGFASVSTFPPNVAHEAEFVAAQREAREQERGLWRACGANDESQAQTPAAENSPGAAAGLAGSGSSPEGEAAASGAITISDIRYDGPGRDVEPGDSEYVVLSNGSDAAVDIGGWSVVDLKDHRIALPAGASVAPGGTFRIYTGPGESGPDRYFAGERQAIWNNSGGDTATLFDASGTEVASFSYNS